MLDLLLKILLIKLKFSEYRTIFTEKGDRTQLNATIDSWQSVWVTVNEKAKGAQTEMGKNSTWPRS